MESFGFCRGGRNCLFTAKGVFEKTVEYVAKEKENSSRRNCKISDYRSF